MAIKLDELLEMYGFILLYCFMLSILINPFILLFVGTDKGTYQTTTSETQAQVFIPVNLTSQYKVISSEELELRNQLADAREWIGWTALLGWMVTSNRFKRGLKKIKDRLSASS